MILLKFMNATEGVFPCMRGSASFLRRIRIRRQLILLGVYPEYLLTNLCLSRQWLFLIICLHYSDQRSN
jgi:hypothetical protein